MVNYIFACLLSAFYMRLVALGERGHDEYEGPCNLDGPIGICNLQIVSICSTKAPCSFKSLFYSLNIPMFNNLINC